MAQAYLLGRMSLRFGEGSDEDAITGDLSAAAVGPDGALWLTSDELSRGRIALSRLTPEAPGVFSDHQEFAFDDFIEPFEKAGKKTEADIEGLDYADHYLWFTGSHSSKRSKPKGKKNDLERLAKVETEPNRYLLGRIPLIEGVPKKSAPRPGDDRQRLTAARLADGKGGNALIEALHDDPHLGPFLQTLHVKGETMVLPLASKENGFDVEGLAVIGHRLFLGLRGPVLRGWATLLEIEPEDQAPGVLGLGVVGTGKRRYRKHFLYLDGLGIRELARDGKDLLILAGPTMALDGTMRMYRLRDAAGLDDDSLTGPEDGRLTPVFDLPRGAGDDCAEGFAPTTWRGLPALLVVYDSPSPARRPAPSRCRDGARTPPRRPRRRR